MKYLLITLSVLSVITILIIIVGSNHGIFGDYFKPVEIKLIVAVAFVNSLQSLRMEYINLKIKEKE